MQFIVQEFTDLHKLFTVSTALIYHGLKII